jgi:hypothetical protein
MTREGCPVAKEAMRADVSEVLTTAMRAALCRLAHHWVGSPAPLHQVGRAGAADGVVWEFGVLVEFFIDVGADDRA